MVPTGGSDDNAEGETGKKSNEKVERNCGYCKKKVLDNIYCIKCEKCYHKSCISRIKGIKMFTQEVGICCYEDDATKNIHLFTLLVKDLEATKKEIYLLQLLKQEMEEKNSLLKDKLHNLENNTCKSQTYANITKNSKNENKQTNTNNIPSIIIKPKNDQDSTRTRKDIDKSINPADLCVGVKQIRNTKNGSVIIKCNSKEDVEIIKKTAQEKLKNTYDVQETKLRKPKIKITGYNQDMTEEDIENSLRRQNKFIEESDILKVTFIKKTRNRSHTVFVECSTELFHKLLYHQKVCIGWERCPVYEDINVLRCFHCQGYYHKNNNCQNTKICSYCSEEHNEADCPKTIQKCKNCKAVNDKYKTTYNIQHSADSQECPTYKYLIQVLRSKIDYGQYNG